MSFTRIAVLEHRAFQHAFQRSSRTSAQTIRDAARWQRQPANSLQRRDQGTVAGHYAHPEAAQPPPRRSFGRRILTFTLGGLTFTLLGVYIGVYTLPSTPQILALLDTPPSDTETLLLYSPPDPVSSHINARILNHPLAASLRKDTSFTESRPHMKIPEALRSTNLTGGTLAGPGRIVVPPLQFSHNEGKSLVSIFYLGEQLCGHPGIIHGGMLATLLDEGLARCCFPALPSKIGVTATLKVDYRKPVRADRFYVLRAETYKVEGRKAWVRGWIEELGDGSEEVGEQGAKGVEAVKMQTGTVAEEGQKSKGQKDFGKKLVEAEALFVEPRNAHVIKRIYQP